jgi:hypothetical protein
VARFEVRDARNETVLRTDVLVVGAGAAGVAAAATAARQGCRVVVLERLGFAGGAAVAGLSGTVCGMYSATETPGRKPEQLVFGFADEFVRLLKSRAGLTEPVVYGHTYTLVHEPLAWRDAGDHIFGSAGVAVLYHAEVTSALADGDHVAGVVASSRGERLRIEAKVTIDASGDAAVAAMTGLRFTVGDNGRVQNPTMIFRLGGVDVARLVAAYGPDTIMPPEVSQAIADANAAGAYRLPRTKIFLFPTPRAGELLCNCTRLIGADGRELNPLISRDLAEAEIQGRRQVREYARFFRDRLAGCEASYVSDTGVQVGVRQTRQIVGVKRLTNDDVVSTRKSASAIARSAWPIELHSGERPKLHWIFDDYYEIPFEAFVPAQGDGLLVSGRCLSAEHEAMASARVTAQCFSYGHAVGHAAAMSALGNMAPRLVSPADIRDALNRDGARLS